MPGVPFRRGAGLGGLRVLAAVVLLAAGLASPAAAAASPIAVRSASLTQDGRRLVWQVELASRFSAAGLRLQHRELCLVVERAASASIAGLACVVPGRGGRGSALEFTPVTAQGRGTARRVPATITRRGASALRVELDPHSVGARYAPLRWQVLSSDRTTACAGASGCSLYVPTQPQLLSLHLPRPVGCVPSGPAYVTNGSRDRHVVALTFDDGPWPDTPAFLDVLEREHVPATFFQIGRQVSTYGRGVDERILADGDILGDHTWDHAGVAGAGTHAAWEISSTRTAIATLTGFTPCLFRAPGGGVSSALINEAHGMGFKTIQWDVDPQDWRRPGTAAILANVLANVRNGSIVLQHDGGGDRSQTLAALPREIHVLRQRGYRFVTIPELLGLRVIYK